MTTNRLTLSLFQPLFRRLMAAHQHRIPDTWLEETVKVYFEPIRHMPIDVVEEAITTCIEDPAYRFFPKTNQLAGACHKIIRDRSLETARQHRVERNPDQCEDCRTEYAWRTWFSARVGAAGLTNPGAFDFERSTGVLVPMLPQTRLLCDCRWRAKLAGLSVDELRAMTLKNHPDAIAESERRATHHQQGTLI